MTTESVLKLGVDSTDVKKAYVDLDGLTAAAGKAEGAANALGAAVGKASAPMGAVAKSARETGSATGEMARGMGDAGTAANALGGSLSAVKGVIGGLSLAAVARQFVQTADAVTVLNNQLRLASSSASDAKTAYAELFGIAQRSRTSFMDLGATFASISRATQEMGISQARLLTVTEAIGNAMAISGGSAASMNAALVQLGQGFASGTLRGEELNSILEQTPRLAKAIADGLGVSIGALRTMGQEGKLTSQAVLGALEAQAKVLSGEVKDSVVTVAQAMTQLGNAAVHLAGQMDKASGATKSISGIAQAAANDIGRLGEAMARAESSGAGFVSQLGAAGALALGRGGFELLNTGASKLNSTINALTGGMAGLNENVRGMPLAFQTTAEQVNTLEQRLTGARTEMASLVALGGAKPGIYLRSQIGDLEAYIARTELAYAGLKRLQGGAGADRGGDRGGSADDLAKAAKIDAGAQAVITELRNKALGVNTALVKSLIELDEASRRLGLSQAEQAKIAQALVAQSTKGAQANKEGSAALDRQRDAAKEWAKALAEAADIEDEATGKTLGLNKAQQELIGYLKSDAYQQHTDAMRTMAVQAYAAASAAIERGKAEAAAIKTVQQDYKTYIGMQELRAEGEREIAAAEQASVKAMQDAEAAMAGRVSALHDEIEAQALSESKHISLAHAVALVTLRRMEDSRAALQNDPEKLASLDRQIEKQRELAGLIGGRDIADANRRAADDAARAWESAFAEVSATMVDIIMDGGRDAGKQLERLFKNLVLRPLVQYGVNEFIGWATGKGGASADGGGMSWGGAYRGAKDAYGAYRTYSDGTVAGGTYEQFMAGYRGSSASMGAGTVGPVTDGAGGAMGAGSSSASAMSTIGPYAIAAIAYAIGADQMADWSLHLGGYSQADRSGVRNIAADIPGANTLDADTIAGMKEQGVYIPDIQKLSDTLASSLFSFADTFAAGVKATSPIQGTQVVFESDRANPSWGQIKFLGAGNSELASTGMQTDLSWDADVAAPQLVARSAGAFATAMQGSDAADWIKASLAKIPAELERITPEIVKQFGDPLEQAQALNQAMVGMLDGISGTFAQLDALDEQLGGLGGAFSRLAEMSSDARYALVSAFGGLEQFKEQIGSYVGAYYTEAERAALTTKQLGVTLGDVGLKLPDTRDGFRALVDAQDLSTESGRKAFGALMGVADAFAAITPAARSVEDIAQERVGLEEKLLALQGNTVELRRRERETIDPSNRALYDRITALEDEIEAADLAKQAAEDAADAVKALADALTEMQQQLGDAASDALSRVRNTIDAKRSEAQTAFDTSAGMIGQQTDEAQARFDVIKKGLDAERKALRDEYDVRSAAIRAEIDGIERQLKAQQDAYKDSHDALRAERESAQDTYKSAADALTKTIDSARQAVGRLAGLRDAIDGTLRSMRPIGSEMSDRSRAQAQIREALAQARAGGQLPAADDLRDSLQTLARPSADLFSSFVDYARDFYRTQIDIRDLGQIAGDQLDQAQTQLDATLELSDTLSTQHETTLLRLDAQLDALEKANDLSRQQLDAQRERAQGSLDQLRTSLDNNLAGIDVRETVARASLDATQETSDSILEKLSGELERTLAELDGQWEQAQAAYDAVVGNNTSALESVAAALNGLNTALSAFASATGGQQPDGTAAVTDAWVTSGHTQVWADRAGAVATRVVGQPVDQAIVQGVNDSVFTVGDARNFVDQQITGRTAGNIATAANTVGISLSGVDALAGFTSGTTAALSDAQSTIAGFTAAQITDTIKTLVSQGNLRRIYDLAVQNGISSYTVDALGGWPRGTSLQWALSQGLPAFEVGTNYVPADMVARIHEGERIVPAADNAQLMAMMRNPDRANDVLVAEVRRLNEKVSALESVLVATATNTGRTARQLDRWDGEGMPDVRA
jgi:tape measure domain-containing protein